jgi:hypothetical protein
MASQRHVGRRTNEKADDRSPATADDDRLSRLVAERVAAISRADPDRSRKCFRVFLEVVLLAEFGERLINDPGFYDLVDRVEKQMAADPELKLAMHSAGTSLLQTHTR